MVNEMSYIPRKYLYFGPFPREMDGGAVVAFYLLKKQNQLRPRDEYYGICKVPEELDPSALPWINFPILRSYEEIPDLMYRGKIPILNLFHIGVEEFEKVVEKVGEVGGKTVLHQTVHWSNDAVTKSTKLDKFDMIVAPTKYARNFFVQKMKISSEKVRIIPHGVDTGRFFRRPTTLRRLFKIRENQKVILYSGRLSFWKGVQELIPIMRDLYHRYDCVFIIRGGAFWGNEESKALYKVFMRMSFNNPNIIYLPDWQTPEFMEELWAMTDICIFNSGHEGFGVPLIEAQAVGAVPIVTALPNHVEICGNTGETSILLDAKKKVGVVNKEYDGIGTDIKIADHNQIYGAIQWLLENPGEAKVMGQRGIKNVKDRFELTNICNEWLKLYDELVPENYNMDQIMREKISV